MGPTQVFFMHPSQDDSSSRAPLYSAGEGVQDDCFCL